MKMIRSGPDGAESSIDELSVIQCDKVGDTTMIRTLLGHLFSSKYLVAVGSRR